MEASAGPALRRNFLAAMSHAACTVSVVTTDGPAGRAGVTVSAMASVSADTPQPTLLVCVHHLSHAAEAILGNAAFCVNVLRDDQSDISDHFAGRVFSFEDVRRPKPAPDIYLAAAAACGVRPARCLVVEDSDPGIAAAEAAGCQVLRVEGFVPDLRCRLGAPAA